MPRGHVPFSGSAGAAGHELVASTTDRLLEVIHLMGQHLEASAESVGLNMIQAIALRSLDTPVSQRELSEELRCDASYVTGIIDRLEEVGAVERQPNPDDRRVKLLHRTVSGDELKTQLEEKLFGDTVPIERGLDQDELRTLHDLLGKIVASQQAESGD